jgi:hypothetical protein
LTRFSKILRDAKFLIELQKWKKKKIKVEIIKRKKEERAPRWMCGIGRPEFQCVCTEITCSVAWWERGRSDRKNTIKK